FKCGLKSRTRRVEQPNWFAWEKTRLSLPLRNLLHGPGSRLASGREVEVGKRAQFPNFFRSLKALELFDHQVTTWTQSPLTALHDIAVSLLIEVVQETPDEDEIVLLVPQVVVSTFPARWPTRLHIPSCARIFEDRTR